VLVEGREVPGMIEELVSAPGAPQVENPQSIRTVQQFMDLVNSTPDTAIVPPPGMVLTDLTVPGEWPTVRSDSSSVGVLTVSVVCGLAADMRDNGKRPRSDSVVMVPRYSELGIRDVATYRRPKDPVQWGGKALQYNRYDAEPEDAELLESLKKRFGDHLNVQDLEDIISELEREAFLSKDKIGKLALEFAWPSASEGA
jgi:hypothetical protein